MKTEVIAGQPSWKFASDKVAAAITRAGGHLAPVSFRVGSRTVKPFSVSPWAEEQLGPKIPTLLRSLRGDFFCLPFGGNNTPYRGEKHSAHGETATNHWEFKSLRTDKERTTLHLAMTTKVRAGQVDKFIELREGHAALYCRHVISGMSGKMNFGHHATLKFPGEPGSGHISTSRLRFGQVLPVAFEEPAKRGYTSLKQGATFTRLDRVATAEGGFTDVSRYPARRGFEDLLMMAHQASPDFAWTAVAFPGERYAWFALKDPRVLQSTVLWISNGGRHYPPWSGRHVSVMGLEDVTSYFHLGLAESAKANEWTRKGFATALPLRKAEPLTVNYIMGVAEIPRDFTRVKEIRRGEGGITLTSTNGGRVSVPVDISFLRDKSQGRYAL